MSSDIPNPPPGWTTSPSDLRLSEDWSPTGAGTEITKRVGLPNPKVLMVVPIYEGGGAVMFTSGGKYYLWNRVADQVVEYVKPAELEGILAEMRKKGGQVEVRVVCEVPKPEPEPGK